MSAASEEHAMRDATAPGDPSLARTWRRRGLLALAALIIVVLATACSGGSTGPGVAGGGSSSSPSSSSDRRTQALAYSQCMRDQGISDFPDPDAEGQVNDPQLEEATDVIADAQQACQHLSPEGDGGSTRDEAAAQEGLLAYSQCMRDHGISGFPDPEYEDGELVLPKNGEFDPLDPAVQEADAACLDALNSPETSPTEARGD